MRDTSPGTTQSMSSAGKRIPIVLGLKIYNIFNFIINDMLE